MPIINTVIAGGGTTPTGTIQITNNGITDVTNYASADVQVPTTAPAHYIEKSVDANGKLVGVPQIINLNGVTDVGNQALYGAYYGVAFPANTSADLSSLTTISGTQACMNMFTGCTGLTSANLSSLTTISGGSSCVSMFQNCAGLTSVNLSSLTTISGGSVCSNMFQNCTGLTSFDLPALTTISGSTPCLSMFQNCTGLISVKLGALNTISGQISASYGQMFSNCSKLESVEFGGLTSSTFTNIQNQIQHIFSTNTGSQAPNGCTVHFPSNFDPSDPNHTFDASTLTGYPTFGGNASYIHVAFDLPATE